jgi:hypothetical protein
MDALLRTFVRPGNRNEHPLVEKAIGKAWLDAEVRRATSRIPPSRKTFSQWELSRIQRAIAHPLISEIRQIFQDGQGYLFRHDLLENCLEQLFSALDFKSLRPRLRSAREYEKVEYELLVAAAYARYGCQVTPNLTSKGADMEVRAGSDEPVWIECKRKDTRTASEAGMKSFREQIDGRLIDALSSSGLNYNVTFDVSGDPTHLRPEDLIANTVSLCSRSDNTSENICDCVSVSVVKLADPGARIPADVLDLFRQSPAGMRKSSMGVEADQAFHVDPIQVQWNIPDDADGRRKGVLESLREAASQLPASGRGVIYIDINLKDYDQITDTFDDANQDIQSELSHHHGRVNCVVVTVVTPSRTMDGKSGWAFDALLVRQADPKRLLPAKLPILGATPNFERAWIVGDWLHDHVAPRTSL